MTRNQVIEKARKIAALTTSPVEGERIAASLKLKLIMSEYNLTMQDLGVTTNSFKNLASNNNSSFSHPSFSDIKEVHYMHSNLPLWVERMLTDLNEIYAVHIIFSYDRIKFLGFPEDIQIFKHLVVHTRKYIEEGIARNGYTDENDIYGYARGIMIKLMNDLHKSVGKDRNWMSKMSIINHFVRTRFNVRTNYIPTHDINADAYMRGVKDARTET